MKWFHKESDRQRPNDQCLPFLRLTQRLFRVQSFSLDAKVVVQQLMSKLGVFPDLPRHLEQLHKDGDFRTQHERFERLDDVIDSAHRIAMEHMIRLAIDRRQEYDRDSLRSFPLSNDMGGLIAIDAGQENIQQYDGELVAQQMPERLLTRPRPNHFGDVLDNRFDNQKIVLVIVDGEYPRAIFGPWLLFQLGQFDHHRQAAAMGCEREATLPPPAEVR